MLLEYRNRNQYGYTVLAVQIDTESKTATLYRGSTAPICPMKKATKKHIKELFDAYAANPEYTVKVV